MPSEKKCPKCGKEMPTRTAMGYPACFGDVRFYDDGGCGDCSLGDACFLRSLLLPCGHEEKVR